MAYWKGNRCGEGYGITSGAKSILGYGSSRLVKTKKKKLKTFQSLKKIFALGEKKKKNEKKQKKKKTIENTKTKKNEEFLI